GEHQHLPEHAHDEPPELGLGEHIAHLAEPCQATDQRDHRGAGDRCSDYTDQHVARPQAALLGNHRTILRAAAPTTAPPTTSATKWLAVAITTTATAPGYARQPTLAARVCARRASPTPVTTANAT